MLCFPLWPLGPDCGVCTSMVQVHPKCARRRQPRAELQKTVNVFHVHFSVIQINLYCHSSPFTNNTYR